MAYTQATFRFLPRFTIMASTMIALTAAGRIDVKRVAREMTPIIGALALVAASTVVWVQTAPEADAPSAGYISTTTAAPAS
jgi:hypothetical protein